MTKVFIDGSSGTTGLRIHERLEKRKDIELLSIPYEQRHDLKLRKDIMSKADIVFLCLPDQASKELMDAAGDLDTVIIDTATIHRTASGWTYGFPEVTGKEKIASAKRIANPGCHATGFIVLIEPLVKAGLLNPSAFLTCLSLTGYSGGGKKMIHQYELKEDPLLKGPRMYGISQKHKHLAEMMAYTGMKTTPAFLPVVGDFYSGMETVIPVSEKDLNGSVEEIKAVYQKTYHDSIIHYEEDCDEDGFFSACRYEGRDDMEVSVSGNEERILLIARYDNLGKGASGSAIQNMNLVLHLPEDTGLIVKGE